MHWIVLQPQLEAAPTATLTDPLLALGWWALQFTPKVALLQGALLLEVSGSTRLWGGQAALMRHIYTSNKPLALIGYAQGDTSLIAYARLLAPRKPPLEPENLPLNTLLAAQPHLATLTRLGCTCWGDLRALPRDGLARRFGAALVDALDQAYGQRPDIYPWLTLPEVFEATLELPGQVENASALLFGARRLLAQMQVWLQLRQRGVLALELSWQMDARRHTAKEGALLLRTAEPALGTEHLQRLLAERLNQITLPAPVLGLRLRTLETQALKGQSAPLLLDDAPQGDTLAQLLERLGARLGADKVLRLHPQADHRPEQMQVWQAAAGVQPTAVGAASVTQGRSKTLESIAVSHLDIRAGGQNLGYYQKSRKKSKLSAHQAARPFTGWASALYPTWLLAEPLPLAVQQAQPHYQGPLTLLAGPQRLESGWWSAGQGASAPPDNMTRLPRAAKSVAGSADTAPHTTSPVALRDYFVARTPGAVLLWIYRERLAGAQKAAWYLQGIFA